MEVVALKSATKSYLTRNFERSPTVSRFVRCCTKILTVNLA